MIKKEEEQPHVAEKRCAEWKSKKEEENNPTWQKKDVLNESQKKKRKTTRRGRKKDVLNESPLFESEIEARLEEMAIQFA